jgi:hypothetical protein
MRSRHSWPFTLLAAFTFTLAGSLFFLATPPATEGRAAGPPAVSQEKLPEEQKAAIRKASEYLLAPTDPVTPMLRKIGFDPDDTPFAREWQHYPAERKIAIAIAYAKAADPDAGEGRAMALLSKDLAQRYAPVKNEKALARYLAMPEPPGRLRFSQPKGEMVLTNLPAEIKNAITVMCSKYLPGSALGGSTMGYIERYTGLSKQAVFDIVVTSDSSVQALEKAVERVQPPKRREVVERMVKQVAQTYQAARYEKHFLPFLKNPRPGPGSTFGPPPGPPPAPSGGGSPRSPTASPPARRMVNVFETHYASPQNRSLGKMTDGVRGLGGIILGAPVTPDKGLGKPASLRYARVQPADAGKGQPEVGKLVIQLEGERVLEFPDVLAEDAYAAHQLLHATPEGLPAYKEGEGLGLAGLGLTWNLTQLPFNSRRVVYEYGPMMKFSREVYVDPVILHPLLVDTPLGHAALRADATPRRYRPHLYDAAGRAFGKESRTALENALERRSWYSAYLIVDVPVTLTAEDGFLVARGLQKGRARALPDGVTRSAFLELRLFTNPKDEVVEKRHDQDLALEFHRLVPLLARVDYNLHRINRFVPVLAVLRWARQQGLECKDLPAAPRKTRTPDVILNDFDVRRFTPEKQLLIEDQLNGGTRALDARLKTLEGEAVLRPHLPSLQKTLERARAEQKKVRALEAATQEARKPVDAARQEVLNGLPREARSSGSTWLFARDRQWWADNRVKSLEDGDLLKPHLGNLRKAEDQLRTLWQTYQTAIQATTAPARAWLEAPNKVLAGIPKEASSAAGSWLYAKQVQWETDSQLKKLEAGTSLKPYLDGMRKALEKGNEARRASEDASRALRAPSRSLEEARTRAVQGIPKETQFSARLWLYTRQDQWQADSRLKDLEGSASLKPQLEHLRKGLGKVHDAWRKYDDARRSHLWYAPEVTRPLQQLESARKELLEGVDGMEARKEAQSWLLAQQSRWDAARRQKDLENNKSLRPHLDALRKALGSIRDAWRTYHDATRAVDAAQDRVREARAKVLEAADGVQARNDAQLWLSAHERKARFASHLEELEGGAALKPHLDTLRKEVDRVRDAWRKYAAASQARETAWTHLREAQARFLDEIKEAQARKEAQLWLDTQESRWQTATWLKELESRASLKPHLDSLREALAKVQPPWRKYDQQRQALDRASRQRQASIDDAINGIQEGREKSAARYWLELKGERLAIAERSRDSGTLP